MNDEILLPTHDPCRVRTRQRYAPFAEVPIQSKREAFAARRGETVNLCVSNPSENCVTATFWARPRSPAGDQRRWMTAPPAGSHSGSASKPVAAIWRRGDNTGSLKELVGDVSSEGFSVREAWPLESGVQAPKMSPSSSNPADLLNGFLRGRMDVRRRGRRLGFPRDSSSPRRRAYPTTPAGLGR